MFLHLIHADPKFLKPIRRLFETAAPGENIYAYYASQDLAFQLPGDAPLLQSPQALSALLSTRKDWRGVVVNGLTDILAPALTVIPRRLKIAWFLWGYEYYELWPSLYRRLYGVETSKWVAPAWKQKLRPWVWRWQGRLRAFKATLRRYDYCVCQLREEYDLLKSQGLNYEMEHIDGAVCALEDLTETDAPPEVLGSDIQVGNSASFTNNFPEIFERLSRLDLNGRKVVVPLSYGDAACRERVLEAGERMLGEHFEPLVDFMPLAEYSRVLQRCGTVIMNHHRQQALGNIMGALWRGARVYLNDTPVYRGYSRMGFEIGLIERDVVPGNTTAFAPLSANQLAKHRDTMWDRFSHEALVAKTRHLLERLSGGPLHTEEVVGHAYCS